jgi:hypothetical protein
MVGPLCFANLLRGAVASFPVSGHPPDEGVDEATPAAACNGKNCLIVWKDNRLAQQPYHRGQYLLYGRRFDLAGNALDAGSFQIQDEPFIWNNEGLTLPAVGVLGRDYLVVWLTRFRQIEGRRVRGDGTVKTNRIEIAQTGTASGQPAVASTRRGYLVAWTDRVDNNGDIYATLLDRNGEVTHVVPVAADSANAQYPVAASVGQDYLVVWRELAPSGEDGIKAALVTHAGEVRRLDYFPKSFASWVAVANNKRNYFITWQTASSGDTGNQFSGCVMNCRGKIVAEELALATCGAPSLPAVVPTGRNFTFLWRENPYEAKAMLYALPVSAQGIAKAPPLPMNCEAGWNGYGTTTALGQSGALVVLEQRTPDYYDNGYLSRISGTVIGMTP